MNVPTLLLTGPGGVGKTTTAFEMSRQLEGASIAHAMVDTDELDRIYPAPPDDSHKTALTSRNLAAVWSNLRDACARRLILTTVAVSLKDELPWIEAAVPEAKIQVVRLRAAEDALLGRVRGREGVGSGEDYQAPRSVEQARLMESEDVSGVLTVETTGRTVVDVAREILLRAGWLV